ncbi:MAG: hypothetical protein MJ176_05145 [Treponema sp.]|nr:hypothetical protein [Treponema sp.]
MNRRSFFKHAVCILFLIFAMGEVWGTDYTSVGDGNWNRPVQLLDNSPTWDYNFWASGQYPKSDTDDNVAVNHNVKIPDSCTDAKANTINVNAGSLSCVGSGKLTANTINVNGSGSLVYTSGMTVNSINVNSGGKIVLNSWPTPAPTFESGCIIEIGPDFPDADLGNLNSALRAVKTAGGTIAELIVSRPTPGTVNLDVNYSITKVTVNSSGVTLGNQDGITSIEVTGNGSLTVSQALRKPVVVNTDGTLELSSGINGEPVINMNGGNLILSGGSSVTVNYTNLANLSLGTSNPISVTVDGPTVTLPASLTTSIPSNVIIYDNSGTITNYAAVPPANQGLPDLVVDGSNSPYTISTDTAYKTITVKNGGDLTIDAGTSVTAKTLTIEEGGSVTVNGNFTANVQESGSYVGKASVSGTLFVESTGVFDSNYAVNEISGEITANGFFKSGNFHNKGKFYLNDTTDHSTNANCCKVVNDGEIVFGDNARFLVYKLSDGDFDGTFTNNKTVTFGNSVYSEISVRFENAANGSVEIGNNTKLLFTENNTSVDNASFINAGNLTVKNGATIGVTVQDPPISATFTNSGYLIREESKIFNYSSDANTLWIENRFNGAKDYELSTDAALVLNVAGNLNLLVDSDTSIKSLNLYSRNHGVSGKGDGKDHTITSDFTVTVKNKGSSTGTLSLVETISVSRTSSTLGVKGTLNLSSKVNCSGQIAISSGTELDINADVSSAGLTQNVLSSNTSIKIGPNCTFTTSDDFTFPKYYPDDSSKHSSFSSQGTVVVKNGKLFQIDTTGTDGAGNITFENGGTLTAKSFTSSGTLTVKTTAAAAFTLNSAVTFKDVFFEGSSEKKLTVTATKDITLAAGGGENSSADHVIFSSSTYPAVYQNDGTTPAEILAQNSSAPNDIFPAGWVDGSHYFIWKGATDSSWTTATNWFGKNSPYGTDIKGIRIDTLPGKYSPEITEDVTCESFTVLSGKTASVTAAKKLQFNSLLGEGTLNLGPGTLKNGNSDGTVLDIADTTLSLGTSTLPSTLIGKIKIQKLAASNGSVNIGTNTETSEVTFVPSISVTDITVNTDSILTLTADSTLSKIENKGTVNGDGALTVNGDFTDTGTWNETGNITFAGTSLISTSSASAYPFVTVTGTATFKTDFTIGGNGLSINGGTVSVDSGKNLTVNNNVINGNDTGVIPGTLSGSGTIKINGNFTDKGTTTISKIVFFGNKNHTFTNKAENQYETIELDSSITDSKIFTVVNNALITDFTDSTFSAIVQFSGTATLGSLTTRATTTGKYTFTKDAKIMADTDFYPEAVFAGNLIFSDNSSPAVSKKADFYKSVELTKPSASLKGSEITFRDNFSANELTADLSKLILNTKPELPITFNVSKLSLTGSGITISHVNTTGTCILTGELDSATNLTIEKDFHVTGDVKITGGGKLVSVASGKKLFCGKNFRIQGTSDNKLTVSGDVAITSNEKWSSCFAEAVFCTIKDSTVYFWNGTDYSSAESSGLKAQIPCESCTDGNNTFNWIFADKIIESARTIDDHQIELLLSDSIDNVASSVTNSGLTTYTALACLKGEGNNPDGTLRNGNWKNYSSQSIIYSIESVAPGTGADSGKTIVIISLPADTTWNTDAATTSAGNASSTDSNGVHQTNIPDIIIERGTGGISEKYTVTNKWGKRFGGTAFTSTSDGASPVLIAVYTGQENHTPGSTDGWDAHNFIEFVYSEEVQGVTAGDAPYTTGAAAGDPKITVDGIASFENGKLDTRNFSDNLENENLNQFYAVGTYSFRWAIASKASGGIWNGYIESITQFSGSVTIPATCVIKDRSSAKNPCIIKTGGLTVSNVKAGDPTVSNWDVIGPDFVPIRKNGEWNAPINSDTNFEIVGTSSSGNAALEKLEFHMFDNAQSFSGSDSVNWVTRNGWINASDYTLLSRYAVTGTFAADIFGGARPFEGTSAGRTGSSVSDRTAGGIRKHTLDSAYTKGAFEYQTVDAEKNVSAVHAFDNLLGDISYGFSAIVFANPDTEITRQVSDPDTLYFGLKLPTSTTELRTTYIISYNPSIGVITDLAGNRFAGTLDGSGKRTVRSIDMTPPKMVMTVSPIGTKRLYVMFAKELQLGKLNLSDIAGQIPTSVNALADIPKSLGLISLPTGYTPATRYLSKTSGEIDIDASVPAKLLFINQNYTGLEFALTKETTLENISNLYLVVKNDSAIENAKDPITGIIGNISYIQDDIGNFLPVNSAHAFSDFAVNAVMPLYAYSTSDAIDGEIVTMNLYGDEQYAVRDFSRDQQNFGTMIPGDDYTFIVKTCDEITDENQFVMIASRSPSAGSVSKIYNETSRTDRRIWLPDAFSAISSVANTNVIESAAPSAVAQGFKFDYSVNGANPVDWGSGDEITFLYEIKKDSFGNDIEICHNPVLSVTGTVDTDAKSPLFALTLDNPADLLSIDLWSFKLKTPVSQRGGVTILNNVINAVYGEKTLVKLDVPKSGASVTVAVMTLDGNIIKYLVSDFLPGGSHYYEWDGTNLNGSPVARGMYFIRVFGDGFDETRKVMVVK